MARVNARYTRRGEAPIDLRLHEDFPTAVAAYTICDVVMVNSIADGMNLVAKEAVSVSRRDAVPRALGEHRRPRRLGAFAVTLYPFDIQQQADALYEALTMPAISRREPTRSCRRHRACERRREMARVSACRPVGDHRPLVLALGVCSNTASTGNR